MTRFLDGPAAAAELLLGRSPLFLRVVQSLGGKWDALDQLSDTPDADETITAYRRVSRGGTIHVDGTDARGRRRGQWFQLASYAVVTDQPDDATLRNTERWRSWCRDEAAKLKTAD